MKKVNGVLNYLSHVQILSALIWASAIIASSWVSDKSNVTMILITAAGFHVVLLSQYEKNWLKKASK